MSPPWHIGDAVREATGAIHQAVRGGTWIPGQQRRMRQLAPATWQRAPASVLGVSPARPGDAPGHAAVEIAIYPDVVWLTARSLRASGVSRSVVRS